MNRYSYFIRTLEKVDLFPCFIFLQNFFLPFNANITLVEMKQTILGYFYNFNYKWYKIQGNFRL